MKLPLSLITSYLPLQESLSQICEALTLLGIEVDHVENQEPPFRDVCAVEILETHPHPSSKTLLVATITDGFHTLSVVTGAHNGRPGLKTAYAKPGSFVGTRMIEESTIRGVRSQGMLCSASELGLPQEEGEGLIELPNEWNNGTDLLPLLWDPVLELSLTPNLGHCMSALGIARELSIAFNRPIQKQKSQKKYPLFLGRTIRGVQNGPSPFWLRQILLKSGLRPINILVDITNYMLLKTGQPMHAYDADKIVGSLSLKVTQEPLPFLGLDQISRTIPKGSLVVCDEQKILALAGIMGDAHSSVSQDTTSVVFEAASFDSLSVRKTSRILNLRTESSHRFERGTDREAIPAVMEEACSLALEWAHGSLAKELVEFSEYAPPPIKLSLRISRVNHILGTSLSQNEIEELITRVGCSISAKEENILHLIIPSYRNDLRQEIDLVEEVARVYGYNNIDIGQTLYSCSSERDDPLFLFENELRKRLVSLGLQEILTSDLISPKLAELSPELLYPKPSLLSVLSSKSEEYSFLRPSLLAGGLDVIRMNLDQKNHSLALFEVGTVYMHRNEPQEPQSSKETNKKSAPAPFAHYFKTGPFSHVSLCSILLTGLNAPHHWDKKPSEWDFYDLKGMLESLLQALRIESVSFSYSHHSSFHPGRQANLFHQELLIGSLGELHPALLEKLDIKQRVLFAELNIEYLRTLQRGEVRYVPSPLFPSTERDWTYSIPQGESYENLWSKICAIKEPLLEKVELIDLYERNATFRFTYRDSLKTIAFEDAEKVHTKILSVFSIYSGSS